MRVFLAGATGVIGRQLVPQLLAAGHQVTATTRSQAKIDGLRAAGTEPVLLDGLDGAAVGAAVAQAEPEVIVHEMTALAGNISFRKFDQTFGATNKLRTAGVDHLLAAAAAQGVPRFIVQSFAGWPYALSGNAVKTEDDPLTGSPPAAMRGSLAAIRHLEDAVTSAPLAGLVLRYGGLYGPGASDVLVPMLKRRQVPVVGSGAGVWSFVHVTDAAGATLAAVQGGPAGIYNVVDDEPATVAEWLPALARAVGAKPPLHVPAWIGRVAAGEAGLYMMTKARGCSNAKAKAELGWKLVWPSWRTGFADGLSRAYPAS
jgi:2-alkyl-3-oxoalkanoate reductase